MSYRYLLDLALILLSTKVLSLVTKRFKLPQVVGSLLAGLILGPAVLNIIHETDFIKQLAEVGVIVLLFNAGLESNLSEFKKSGKTSFIVAVMGVIIPLIGGTILAYCINHGKVENVSSFVQNIFIGSVLTATSVSITVETLRELGKVSTSVGNIIVGAAIIDDILGIIVLTIVTSLGGGKATAGDSAPLWLVLLKIALFFVFVAIFGYIVYKFFKWWRQRDGKGMHRHAIMAFVICLLMSFAAEYFFGVADITGAFFAGVIISMTQEDQFIASKFDVIGYMFLSPIFFASIGLKVDGDAVMSMGWTVAVFAVLLTVIAVVTKIIGCGLGAKVCGYKNYQCIRIGVGMISRGEVALIVANKGIEAGLMSSAVVAPVIIVVIVTTIVTPIVLKPVFMSGNKTVSDVPTTSKLVENYEQREEIGKTNR